MNTTERLLAEQRRTNDLLALLCELQIAWLENDFYASECRHRLAQIMQPIKAGIGNAPPERLFVPDGLN